MKALVLSGGSIKGAWQAGAIRAVLEKRYEPKIITGISVGAVNGAYLANQAYNRTDWVQIGKDLANFWADKIKSPSDLIEKKGALKLGWQILRKKFDGMVSVEPMRKLLYSNVSAHRIQQSGIKYFCGYADLEKGNIVYATPFDNIEEIFASAAIPLILPTVKIGDTNNIDGGVRDSAPLKKAIQEGATQIVCIATMPEKLTYINTNWGDVLVYGNRLMDIISNNTLNNDIQEAEFINSLCPADSSPKPDEPHKGKRRLKLTVIRPEKQISATISNFNEKDIKEMLDDGYEQAKNLFRHF